MSLLLLLLFPFLPLSWHGWSERRKEHTNFKYSHFSMWAAYLRRSPMLHKKIKFDSTMFNDNALLSICCPFSFIQLPSGICVQAQKNTLLAMTLFSIFSVQYQMSRSLNIPYHIRKSEYYPTCCNSALMVTLFFSCCFSSCGCYRYLLTYSFHFLFRLVVVIVTF